jgi:hypothetical protein
MDLKDGVGPVSKRRNEFHVVFFDPGGHTGWAHLTVHVRAFTKPENKVLPNILSWYTGEFSGPEHDQLRACTELINSARYGEMPYNSRIAVGSEDFTLTQMIGGEELLIPVRMNAVLAWECQRLYGTSLILQARQMRTGVTKDRLKLWNLWPVVGKDAFAAMQHALTYVRRIKQESIRHPWKLDVKQ